jgi:exonuclease III
VRGSLNGRKVRKEDKDKLLILNFNAQGLKTPVKYNLFCDFLKSVALDIAFISEHWLGFNEVRKFHVPGYKLIAAFGRKSKERGGTLILAKNTLNCQFHKLKLTSKEGVLELCGVKTTVNGRGLKLISLYRPSNPESNANLPLFFSMLEDLQKTSRRRDDIIIAGDFNIDLLNKVPKFF